VFLEEVEPVPATTAFTEPRPALVGRPYVLSLGRLHYKKGLDVLAEAFRLVAARCPEARLVVAGPDDGAKVDFERRVAAMDLTERVHLVGPLFGAAKWAALAGAACFCLP